MFLQQLFQQKQPKKNEFHLKYLKLMNKLNWEIIYKLFISSSFMQFKLFFEKNVKAAVFYNFIQLLLKRNYEP